MQLKRILAVIVVIACSALGLAAAAAPPKPKLILAIVVDQFRYDYLLRFRGDYTSGLKTLLEQGAVFDDAHYVHFPTVTAVGHSTFLSGATPSQSGIIDNAWYDRRAGKAVTSVSDDDTKLVGGIPTSIGSSPRKLLVSTLGDEIKMQGVEAKVISVSIKDRSAILPAGHMADAAYWFDSDSNRWTTSSFFMATLPQWVQDVNAARPHARTIGGVWMPVDAKPDDKPFCTMVAGEQGVRSCGALEATPWGNEIIEELAERAVSEEKMGHHAGTDLLAVSFSSNDYVGHAVGPDAPEVRDISIRTDRLLGRLLETVDRQVGLANVMVVLTADHGVAPVPSVSIQRKMPGGLVAPAAITGTIQKALETKYGAGKWILYEGDGMVYFNREVTAKYKVSTDDAARIAAEAARQVPHVARVYTAEEVRNQHGAADPVTAAVNYAYYGSRSGDLYVLLEPFYLEADTAGGTSHGTPYGYDNHVPVIFFGQGIRAGHYYQKIAVNDVAPTLAAIAGVEAPSGSIGRVLQEMWQ